MGYMCVNEHKNGAGFMTEPKGDEFRLVQVPMNDTMINRIDDFRFASRIPARTTAIRELIEAGLATKILAPQAA